MAPIRPRLEIQMGATETAAPAVPTVTLVTHMDMMAVAAAAPAPVIVIVGMVVPVYPAPYWVMPMPVRVPEPDSVALTVSRAPFELGNAWGHWMFGRNGGWGPPIKPGGI